VVPDVDFLQGAGVAFEIVLRGLARSVVGVEGVGQHLVHDLLTCVQPDDGDGKEDEEHANGRQAPALPAFDEDVSLVLSQGWMEHEPQAPGEGRGAPLESAGDFFSCRHVPDHGWGIVTCAAA